MGIAYGQDHGLRFFLLAGPVNWLRAHYAQPIVPMGHVKMGWAGPTRPIDDPYFHGCITLCMLFANNIVLVDETRSGVNRLEI